VRSIEQYANEYARLGLLEFRREHGRPALIGIGIVGELQERSRGRSGTLRMQPVREALPAESLVGRIWLVTKGPYGPRGPAIQGGRDSSNDLVIPEFTISNEHFQFRYDISRLVLSDLGSTNGTFVNGERIEPGRRVPVATGARIIFGRYQFEFMSGPVFVNAVAQIAGEANVDSLEEPMVP